MNVGEINLNSTALAVGADSIDRSRKGLMEGSSRDADGAWDTSRSGNTTREGAMTSSLRDNDTDDSNEDTKAMVIPMARRFSLSSSALKDADEAWYSNRSGG